MSDLFNYIPQIKPPRRHPDTPYKPRSINWLLTVRDTALDINLINFLLGKLLYVIKEETIIREHDSVLYIQVRCHRPRYASYFKTITNDCRMLYLKARRGHTRGPRKGQEPWLMDKPLPDWVITDPQHPKVHEAKLFNELLEEEEKQYL